LKKKMVEAIKKDAEERTARRGRYARWRWNTYSVWGSPNLQGFRAGGSVAVNSVLFIYVLYFPIFNIL